MKPEFENGKKGSFGLKIRILSVLLIACIIAGCFIYESALTVRGDETEATDAESEEIVIEGLEVVAENDDYAMYVNGETTAVSVLVKSTGKFWGTNPDDAFLSSIPNEVLRAGLMSQIELKYYNTKDAEIVLNNYTDAIAKGQFVINQIPDGVEILYEIGMKDAIMIAPKVFRVEAYEALLEKMTEEDATYMNKTYYLAVYSSMSAERQKTNAEDYPSITKEDLYVIRELSPDVEKSVPIRTRKKLDELLRRYEFTVDDLLAEYTAVGHESSETSQALFIVPVSYTLNADGMRAKIETDRIQYDKNSFFLNTISFLRYFGAGLPTDDGYMFVPDGSGAIIDYSHQTLNNYYKPIYGNDNSYQVKQFQEYSNQSVMPVYGQKSGENAFLAIIEEGAANASLMAYTSSVGAGLCDLSPIFDYLNKESYILDNIKSKALLKFSTASIQDDISIQFNFLTGDDANYSGMARKYRSILFEGRQPLSKDENDIPLYLESIGAIYSLDRVMGFNVWRDRAATTYSQAGEIASTLRGEGIENIVYKYKNWANGGMGHQSYSTNVNYISPLGGKKDFAGLVKQAEEEKWRFYPNVELLYIENNSLFDGFVEVFDASRDLSGQSAYNQDFNIAMLMPSWWEYKLMLSPEKLTGYAEKFMRSYNKLSLNNISFETLGRDLNSEFKKDAVVTRSKTADIVSGILQTVSEGGKSIAVDAGNSYAIPYADVIFNVPTTSSAYDIETLAVPFTQIVLHGYVEFCGEAINLSGDPDVAVLHAAEQGAGLHYLVNYEKDTIFKNTYFSKYYTSNFERWQSHIVENYNRLNSELNGLSNVPIYEHNRLAEDVFETVYENGDRVLVNYGETEYVDELSGITINALDFVNVTK